MGPEELAQPGKVLSLPMQIVVRKSTGPAPKARWGSSTGNGAVAATKIPD
jgi:hypothetical protein